MNDFTSRAIWEPSTQSASDSSNGGANDIENLRTTRSFEPVI